MPDDGAEGTFWKLQNASEISTPQDFYKHFQTSDHLKSSIYKPDELTREDPKRTQKFEGIKFEKVSFSKTKIRSIIFRDCEFKNCQFIGTEIIDCEFHGCLFINTNTHKISIKNTYIDPQSFKKCLDKKKYQNIGVHLYQVIMKNSQDSEQIEFERDSQFLFLRWKRYQDTYEFMREWSDSKHTIRLFPISKFFLITRRFLWEKCFGCGIVLRNFLLTVFSAIVIFSIINFYFRKEFGLSSNEGIISEYSESLYFTTISLTTLGYGDIIPTTTVGRLVASFQSVVGFSLFALLASMLFKRVAP